MVSEQVPWCSTGGLGAIASALPRAQSVGGAEVAVFVPLHRGAASALRERGMTLVDTGERVSPVDVDARSAARILHLPSSEGLSTYFIDHAGYYDRPSLYCDGGGRGACDEPARYALLARAALDAAPALLGAVPDVVHAHDWQAGLAPLMMRRTDSARYASTVAIFTIHNLAYQGVFPKSWVPRLGLDWSDFHLDAFEFHDQLCFLKAGIAFADRFTTVSPTYAREIRTVAFGEGLDGFLAAHGGRLSGILNGIDTETWNPSTDPLIAARYCASDLAGKAECRAALVERFGLGARATDPVLGVVSRFARQKGLDVLAEVVPALVELDIRLVVLGSGDDGIADQFCSLATRYPDHVAVYVGFDPVLSHAIEAGSDAFVMPSRYEPCGLNQMYSMRYGTLPIVHSVGGLADTVVDVGLGAVCPGATGFAFGDLSPRALLDACGRAARLFRNDPEGWRVAMATGMAKDFGWAAAARAYGELYLEARSELPAALMARR